MNIPSVDLQVMIPRVTTVAKVQQDADNSNFAGQQQTGHDMQKIASNRREQVQTKPKAEHGKIGDYKEKKQQNRREDSKKHNHDTGDKDKDEANNILGHTIDIKL
jgi:hypothetical protein